MNEMRAPDSHTTAEILVVEDDQGDAELVRIAIDTIGTELKVAFAQDCEEALTWLDAEAAAPAPKAALILLDLNLPRITGIEFLQRMRRHERLSSLPIVVLTSSGRAKDMNAALEAGAAEFLTKPVAFEQFVREIKRLILKYVRKRP